MITLDQYAGKWIDGDDFARLGRDNAEDKLLPAVNRLIEVAKNDGVVFKINPATGSIVSGETLGGFRPQSCTIGAPKSNHKIGMAVDIYDPDEKIDTWCMNNLDKLEECGIWLEHPSATKSWSHWQCVGPKSGRRVFYP